MASNASNSDIEEEARTGIQEEENLNEKVRSLTDENDQLKRLVSKKDLRDAKREEKRQKALHSFQEYVSFRKIYGGPVSPKSYDFWKGNGGKDITKFLKSWAKKKR